MTLPYISLPFHTPTKITHSHHEVSITFPTSAWRSTSQKLRNDSTKPVEPHPLGEVGDLVIVPAVPPVPGDDLLLLGVALQHAQLPSPLIDVRHRR